LTSAFYDKRHLVPFGEFIPFAADVAFLRTLLQGMDFSPGNVTSPLPLEGAEPAGGPNSFSPLASLGVLICYEAIFPSLAQERVAQGADVLVNVSNDGWFRRSSAPWQHLSHAVMRAVEQGKPLLRATNTGISAVIDATGGISSCINGLFTADTLTATTRPVPGTTIFHRIFPVPEICFAVLAFFSLFGYALPGLVRHRNSHVSTH
jgi:apolipoprotein N-acyltransferase